MRSSWAWCSAGCARSIRRLAESRTGALDLRHRGPRGLHRYRRIDRGPDVRLRASPDRAEPAGRGYQALPAAPGVAVARPSRPMANSAIVGACAVREPSQRHPGRTQQFRAVQHSWRNWNILPMFSPSRRPTRYLPLPSRGRRRRIDRHTGHAPPPDLRPRYAHSSALIASTVWILRLAFGLTVSSAPWCWPQSRCLARGPDGDLPDAIPGRGSMILQSDMMRATTPSPATSRRRPPRHPSPDRCAQVHVGVAIP